MKLTLLSVLCLGFSLALAAQVHPPDSAKMIERYGKLPLTFEANQGQSDSQVKFLSHGSGYSLFLTQDEALLTLHKVSQQAPPSRAPEVRPTQQLKSRESGSAVLRMKLLGSNAQSELTGQDEVPAKSNYFMGNDPAKWHTDVSQFAKVRYQNIYPGVDLLYYGHQRELEYDFVLQPGADPKAIRLGIEGASNLRISHGDLVLTSSAGDVHLRSPHIYQEVNGVRKEVRGGYLISGKDEIRFQLGAYDPRRILVIDPILAFSTFLGGNSPIAGYDNRAYGIAVDPAGNAYVTGFTDSAEFPRLRPLQPALDGDYDAFVAKFNADGGLIYSTYLGGSGFELGSAIAADSIGNAYVTGSTNSTDFPIKNAIQPAFSGSADAFVVKINFDGSALLYSTFLGGNASANGNGIAVDSKHNAYLTGWTNSADFPTRNALQPVYGGNQDAFVTKINAGGSAFVYSTYLGGSDLENGTGIAVDSTGNAYVTGDTSSSNFPTKNAFQPSNAGAGDAFVTKVNASGSASVYSTFLGGSGAEHASGIAVDSTGNAYVTGSTLSADFPIKNAFRPTFDGSVDGFVTKLNGAGSTLVYSTYFNPGVAIALDSTGDAYVTNGQGAVLVNEINPAGSALVFSTTLDGMGDDFPGGIAVSPSGAIYVAGTTSSLNFPTTPLAFQKTRRGLYDVFVTKIAVQTFLKISPTAVAFPKEVIGTTTTKTVTLTNQGLTSLVVHNIYSMDPGTFGETHTCGTLPPGASCTISITFTPSAQGRSSSQVVVSDSDPASPQIIKLVGYGTPISVTPTGLSFPKQPVGTSSAPRIITLTNVIGAPLNFGTVTITGANATDFSATTTCGTTIPAHSSCTVTVTFKPTAIGIRKAAVSLSNDGSGSPRNLSLAGTGT